MTRTWQTCSPPSAASVKSASNVHIDERITLQKKKRQSTEDIARKTFTGRLEKRDGAVGPAMGVGGSESEPRFAGGLGAGLRGRLL